MIEAIQHLVGVRFCLTCETVEIVMTERECKPWQQFFVSGRSATEQS